MARPSNLVIFILIIVVILAAIIVSFDPSKAVHNLTTAVITTFVLGVVGMMIALVP